MLKQFGRAFVRNKIRTNCKATKSSKTGHVPVNAEVTLSCIVRCGSYRKLAMRCQMPCDFESLKDRLRASSMKLGYLQHPVPTSAHHFGCDSGSLNANRNQHFMATRSLQELPHDRHCKELLCTPYATIYLPARASLFGKHEII